MTMACSQRGVGLRSSVHGLPRTTLVGCVRGTCESHTAA